MKKKLIAYFLVLVLCVCLLPVTAMATSSGNKLINGGFENGMTGWVDPDGLWNTVTSESGYDPIDGSYFAWPNLANQQDTSIYQDVSLSGWKAGNSVLLNVWITNYDQAPHDMGTVTLSFLDSTGKVLRSISQEQRNPVWLQHTIIATIPTGAVTARTTLKATWYVGNDVDAYFDAGTLNISTEKYNMVYITGDKDKASTGDTVQLVANNSVSKNPTDYTWWSSYNDTATVDASGKVTFLGSSSDSVVIYATDKTTGVTGSYRINSDIPNEVDPAATGSSWASKELQAASDLGLIPDSLQGADMKKDITRAEFAAVCVKVCENLSGLPVLPAVINPFTDCNDIEVLKAYNIGAVNGTSATTFDPNALLNREQTAAMLTRVFKHVTIPGWTLATDSKFNLTYTKPSAFADDAAISGWAKDSVYFMVANSIINGVGNNNFAPKNVTPNEEAVGYANATREQALLIAVRMVENLGSK